MHVNWVTTVAQVSSIFASVHSIILSTSSQVVVAINSNDAVTPECSLRGYPLPALHWRKNGTPLPPDASHVHITTTSLVCVINTLVVVAIIVAIVIAKVQVCLIACHTTFIHDWITAQVISLWWYNLPYWVHYFPMQAQSPSPQTGVWVWIHRQWIWGCGSG